MLRVLSQEAIKYQVKDKFFDQLTGIIAKMYADIDARRFKNNSSIIRSGYGAEIEKLIKNRFNINVVVDPDIAFVAPLAIVPFSSDKLNQLSATTPNMSKAMLKKINPYNDGNIRVAMERFNDILYENKAMTKRINGKRGSINRVTATVTGYLAEVRHFMIFNIFAMKKAGGLTPAELAAATIHEIGHAFTGLEYHYKMVTTNNAISEVMMELNNNNIDKALYTFKTTFGPKELEEAGLSKDSTREDFAGAMVVRYMKTMDSQYQSKWHDATNFEYLSDNFATKMGAGKYLSLGLDKLNTKFSYEINKDKWYNARLISLSILGFVSVASLSTSLGAAYAFGWFIGFILFGLIWAKSTPIYDNYKDRHVRISNEIANILKDVKLPDEEKRSLINQYECIKSIEEINFNFEPYEAIVMGLILPSVRKNKYYKKKQQKIESLMNNGLFVAAAKLNTL